MKQNLYDAGAFAAKIKNKNELIKHLKDLHEDLHDRSQEMSDRPKGLKAVAQQLIQPKILKNSDKDVRLLTACCLVDVLRIYAPEAPFNDAETVGVFDALVSQLRGLSTYDSMSGISAKVLYILSSLSTVKSCVVPVILAQSGVAGADETVISLFDALLSEIRTEHSEDIMGHCYEIMQACIEE